MVNSRQRYPASPRRPFAHRGTAEAALSCDLIWMDFEQLRQLSQGSVDFDGGQRHLRLESRGVVPACRLLIVSPDSRANLARRQAEAPLIAPLDLRGRLSLLAGRKFRKQLFWRDYLDWVSSAVFEFASPHYLRFLQFMYLTCSGDLALAGHQFKSSCAGLKREPIIRRRRNPLAVSEYSSQNIEEWGWLLRTREDVARWISEQTRYRSEPASG